MIRPLSNQVVAPFDGQVVIIFDTKHAIVLRRDDGLALVIHIGVDINKLDGNGFKVLVKDGDIIKTGDCLLEMDFDYLNSINYDCDTHVLFPSLGMMELNDIQYGMIDFLDPLCKIK